MAFNRPTLDELITRNDSQFSSRLGIGPLLRRSILGVLSRIVALASHLNLGFIRWIFLQVFPDTAEAEQLDRWASIWGVLRKESAFSTGSLDVTFTAAATVPVGTIFKRADGTEYETNAVLTTAVPGVFPVTVDAVLAGTLGDAVAATPATLISPIAGVTAAAAVATAGIGGGADDESDTLLRGRLLSRIQNPPAGGNSADYEAWTLEVDDVTRAWVFPLHLGIGTVGVTFTTDDLVGGPIPIPAKVTEVQDYIDEPGRRPVTAAVTVFAPVAVPLNLTIALTPDTATIRAAVEAEVLAMLRRDAVPGGPILVSHIREAISVASGETNHVLSVPAADVTHATGELATMGVVTWL